jgi:hypothetical protein
LSIGDNFFLKVSEGLSTDKSFNEAQPLKFNSKLNISRAVGSPPLTLQTVVIERSSNIAGNVPGLLSVWAFENCQPKTKA